jgi:autotransporter-associated beta strand protein
MIEHQVSTAEDRLMRHFSGGSQVVTSRLSPAFFSLAVACLAIQMASQLQAENWIAANGTGAWGDSTQWTEGTVPNAIGAAAIFPSATGTRTITLGASGNPCPASGCNFTVGSLNVTTNSSSSSTIRNDSTNSPSATLIFDAAGSGPATITASGTGTNQTLILATMVFTDTLDVNVTSTTTGTAGLLSLTGDITGPGGLTKDGPGMMTMAFISGSSSGIKNYQGPTVVNNGTLRLSQGGTPTMTSSVTVNSGGQLLLITGVSGSNTGIYTFGSNSNTLITLNGTGSASKPGAIRLDTTNPAPTQITNLISLANQTSFNITNSTDNILKLNNAVSGLGGIIVNSLGATDDTGTLVLQGANTYAGGTLVDQGTLMVDGTNATLGLGNVTVDGTTAGTSGKLIINAGVAKAMSNLATLTLTGGGAAGSADFGYVELDANDTVGGLVLGGIAKAPGTYGSSSSTAMFKDDEYFAGSGVLTVSPEFGVAGDYNANGVVDMADYVLWRNGGPIQNEVASAGVLDAADYDAWRARFGNSAGSGAGLKNAAVPEPSAFLISALLFSLGITTTRIRSAVSA